MVAPLPVTAVAPEAEAAVEAAAAVETAEPAEVYCVGQRPWGRCREPALTPCRSVHTAGAANPPCLFTRQGAQEAQGKVLATV